MVDFTGIWITNETDPASSWFSVGPNLSPIQSSHENETVVPGAPDAVDKLELMLPRFTALISLLAVLCVATEAWIDLAATRRSTISNSLKRRNRIRSSTTSSRNVETITHIQFCYQIPLFCHALMLLLGTLPAPQSQGIWGALGNTATCSLQGFIFQFSLYACVGWDATLSISYLMMVRYNVDGFRLRSWEKYYHLIIWLIALGMSIYPLTQEFYNFNHAICWLESLPVNCVADGVECIRGAGANLWQTMISGVTAMHMVYSIIIMLCLYCSIRGLENEASQRQRQQSSHMSRGSSSKNNNDDKPTTDRRYSRAVGIQGMLYASGILLTTLPVVIYVMVANLTGVYNRGFGIFATSMTPLLGYVNFVIFMRGRSVEDCHTRYSRFLRRAHSFLFDRTLYCRCECRCLTVRSGEEDLSNTASSTDFRDQEDPRISSSDITTSMDWDDHQDHIRRNTHTQTLASIQEDGNDKGDGDDDDGEDEDDDGDNNLNGGTRRGFWSGFWITWKQGGLARETPDVSELGHSLDASDHKLDLAPSQPRRFRSEVEAPPALPVRVESCAADLVEANSNEGSRRVHRAVDGILEEAGVTSNFDRLPGTVDDVLMEACFSSGCKRQGDYEVYNVAPTLPQRHFGEAEDIDLECMPLGFGAPTLPRRLASEAEPPQPQLNHEPCTVPVRPIQAPKLPLRLVSEIEIDHAQVECGEVPAIPVRQVSEVEHPHSDAPDWEDEIPIRPVRQVSEFEPSSSEGNDSGWEARAPPSRQVGKIKKAECNKLGKVAPTFPLRQISEVEEPVSKHGTVAAPRLPARHVSEAEDTSLQSLEVKTDPAPRLPARHVSEVEDPSLLSPDLKTDPAPRLPRRLVSEVEDPSLLSLEYQTDPAPRLTRRLVRDFVSELTVSEFSDEEPSTDSEWKVETK